MDSGATVSWRRISICSSLKFKILIERPCCVKVFLPEEAAIGLTVKQKLTLQTRLSQKGSGPMRLGWFVENDH